MGRPMAASLMKNGLEVLVYNRTKQRADDLLARGARWANSPAEVAARSEIVIVMVSDDDAAQNVLVGPSGIIHQVGPGTVIANMSTVSLERTRAFHAAMHERKGLYLDAPVAGSTGAAKGGDLIIFVGGDKAAIDVAMPAFKAMGREVIHLGPSGSGITMKLITNAVLGLSVAACAEAFALGKSAGLSMEAMVDAFSATSVASPVLKRKGRLWREGRYPKAFSERGMLKDLTLASRLATQNEAPVPLIDLARSIYTLGVVAGQGDEDFAAVLRSFERMQHGLR